jgi:hypothetical protein
MAGVFIALLLLSILGLIVGLVKPHSFPRKGEKVFTRKQTSTFFALCLVIFFVLVGISAPNSSNASKNVTFTNAANAKSASPKITYSTITKTQSIPFNTTTIQDGSLLQGTTKITTAGMDGVETLTYKDTYTDGKLTAEQQVGQATTTAPVSQVTSIGTYVAPAPAAPSTSTGSGSSLCTNGTYVNSAGNTVCSPEQSSTVPAGATAQCVDGTYSFSQSRSGTCSHHGGVAQWLN